MPFPQAPADGSNQAGFGVVGGHVGDVLEVVQQVQVGGGAGPVKEGYKVVARLLKPSLGLFELVGRRQVLLPHPGSATGHLIAPGDHYTLQHIQVYFGVDFQADFKDVRWHDVALTWNHTKPCARPVIRGNPAIVLAMVLLSSLGSIESMSCTVAHLRSRSLNIVSLSDMIEGSYRSWELYTTGQLVDGLQQKKKTGFH